MEVIKNKNLMQKEPLFENGKYKGVPIFTKAKEPMTFVNCNLINCEVPADAKVIGGNTGIIKFEKEKQTKYGIYENGKIKYLKQPKETLEPPELTEEELKLSMIYEQIEEYEKLSGKKFKLNGGM